MESKIVEVVQSRTAGGNWGKFLVMMPDTEWAYESRIDKGHSLMRSMGYRSGNGERIWLLDMQTGEGAFFWPGGSAHNDLKAHAVWVCPLYEPFLEWLYAGFQESGYIDLENLPEVVELPDAPFASQGYRRPGPFE